MSELSGAARFAELIPQLFHAADRSALPLIQEHGLLSARALACLFGVPVSERPALLTRNRDRFVPLGGNAASLRVQHMRDGPLRSRLDPAISLGQWRRFINRYAFLWSSRAYAEKLARFERGRTQVVLAWDTVAVLRAGVRLLACRYNNGSTQDRLPLERRRRRSFGDYLTPEEVEARAQVKEVLALHGIPPSVPFAALETC